MALCRAILNYLTPTQKLERRGGWRVSTVCEAR